MKMEKQKKLLDIFFKTEYQKLLNYVKKNIEDRYFDASPEDIIQDVAVNMIARLDVDIQITNLAGYVYRSLRNKIIDTKRNTNNIIPIENIANSHFDNSMFIADENENSDLININYEVLYDAISNLKPDEQAIIMLTEFENKSFSELSEKWNIPVGTLLSRKHRALSKLFKILTNSKNSQITKIYNHGKKGKLSGKISLAS